MFNKNQKFKFVTKDTNDAFYDLGTVFCKKGLNIVNIDLGTSSLNTIYMALFHKNLYLPNTVQMIRVVNYREINDGNPRVCCCPTAMKLWLTKPLKTPVTIMVG